MGIYKTIQDNAIGISLHHSKKTDSFLFFDANEAIIYSSTLIDGLNQTSTTITTLGDLFNYFATKRIASFVNVIDSVNVAENKEVLIQLVDAASVVEKAFSIGEVIRFVNCNYKNLFIRSKMRDGIRELFFPLVEFCIQYQCGVSDEVFSFLASEHSYVFVLYYDEIKKTLLASATLFDKVFTEDNVKNLLRTKCQTLLEIAKSISESKQILAERFALLNTRIIAASVEIMNNSKDRDFLIYGDSMRRVRRYLSEINNEPQALTEFENAYKLFDKKLAEYFEHHGHTFSHEIPSDMADQIFRTETTWINKLLFMTHTIKDNAIVSQFSYTDLEEPSIMDMVSHNIDTDEYFTYSRQQNIRIAASVGTALLMQVYCNQQYRESCILWLSTILDAITTEICADDYGLVTDLVAIDQALQFVEAARTTKGAEHCWSLLYGASMLIIACTEKVLRLVFKAENNIILSDDVIQLGALLNHKTVKAVLTEDLMKGVGFYLSKYGYIGLNYRNRLAHLSEIKTDEIKLPFPYTLFYLYMGVINGVFIHYCVKQDGHNEKL